MQCELCSHEVDENEVEVLEIYNDYYGEADRFWACPDCVDENALRPKKEVIMVRDICKNNLTKPA